MWVTPILAGRGDGTGCRDTCTLGWWLLADIPWDMREWGTQDPAVSRVLTGGTTAPTASKGWVLGWEER